MATNYTLEGLAEIEAALASGVLRVSHGGTMTEFRTYEDMIRQIRLMRSELGLPIGEDRRTPAIRRVRFLTNKGLGRFFGP